MWLEPLSMAAFEYDHDKYEGFMDKFEEQLAHKEVTDVRENTNLRHAWMLLTAEKPLCEEIKRTDNISLSNKIITMIWNDMVHYFAVTLRAGMAPQFPAWWRTVHDDLEFKTALLREANKSASIAMHRIKDFQTVDDFDARSSGNFAWMLIATYNFNSALKDDTEFSMRRLSSDKTHMLYFTYTPSTGTCSHRWCRQSAFTRAQSA